MAMSTGCHLAGHQTACYDAASRKSVRRGVVRGGEVPGQALDEDLLTHERRLQSLVRGRGGRECSIREIEGGGMVAP